MQRREENFTFLRKPSVEDPKCHSLGFIPLTLSYPLSTRSIRILITYLTLFDLQTGLNLFLMLLIQILKQYLTVPFLAPVFRYVVGPGANCLRQTAWNVRFLAYFGHWVEVGSDCEDYSAAAWKSIQERQSVSDVKEKKMNRKKWRRWKGIIEKGGTIYLLKDCLSDLK